MKGEGHMDKKVIYQNNSDKTNPNPNIHQNMAPNELLYKKIANVNKSQKNYEINPGIINLEKNNVIINNGNKKNLLYEQKISDDEIFTSLQKNARLMQETMDKINTESENLERLLGDIDEDAKQSLIYGQLSVEDWQKRKQQLLTELGNIKIDNSVESSGLNDAQKKNILL